MTSEKQPKIAIFASGSGTNADKMMQYFSERETAKVALILSNKPDALVLDKATNWQVPSCVFDRNTFYQTEKVLSILTQHHIDWLILAGFLWLVPTYLLRAYPNRIVNIHPALLPKFGGKGMYGMHVHKAVVEQGETETGITIHLANEHFDEGQILFQAKCPVLPTDTPEIVAQKVQILEHQHFAPIIEQLIQNQLR